MQLINRYWHQQKQLLTEAHTLELNANRNVWICVPEQTLKSNPRESTSIIVASCNIIRKLIIYKMKVSHRKMDYCLMATAKSISV
jgi:hypothetical protein